MAKEVIRTATGVILGYIETESNGDKMGFNNVMQLVGRYRKATNTTQAYLAPYSGQIAYKGDALSALIVNKGRIV